MIRESADRGVDLGRIQRPGPSGHRTRRQTSLMSCSTLLASRSSARARPLGSRPAIASRSSCGGRFHPGFFAILAAGLIPVPLVPPVQAAICCLPPSIRQPAVAAAVAVVTGRRRTAARSQALSPSPRLILSICSAPALRSPRRFRCAPATALLQFTSARPPSRRASSVARQPHHQRRRHRRASRRQPDACRCRGQLAALYHDMGPRHAARRCLEPGRVIMSPVLFLSGRRRDSKAISRYHGTISFAPNFAYDLCLRRVKPSQIETLDLTKWRRRLTAPSRSGETLQAFADRFASAGFQGTSFVRATAPAHAGRLARPRRHDGRSGRCRARPRCRRCRF